MEQFVDFLEKNFKDRYITQIIINVERKLYNSEQFIFDNLTRIEVLLIVSQLTNNIKIFDFLEIYREGMIFIVRFDSAHIKVILKNNPTQPFFEQSIKWFQQSFETDMTRIDIFFNDLNNLGNYQKIVDLFEYISYISYAFGILELIFDPTIINDKYKNKEIYDSSVLLLGFLSESFQIVSVDSYVSWITNLSNQGYVPNSIEVYNNGSFILTIKKSNI